MTRTHAARRLLELGPLMYEEFEAITGWPPKACQSTLKHLKVKGIAGHNGAHNRRTVWALTRKGRTQ